jgi:polyphosphate kinase 2 (PPK2 family)
MNRDKLVKQAARLAEPFCVTKGEKFRLKDLDPADTTGVKSKQHAQNILDAREGVLNHLQEKLYAQDRWAVLVVLQGLDAAGKDGVIKHVMSGVNPQGCSVFSFKSPSTEELDHDTWRAHACPERGRIGIFNALLRRSIDWRPPYPAMSGVAARRNDHEA